MPETPRKKTAGKSDPILTDTDMLPQTVTCDNLRDKDPEKYKAIVEWLTMGRTQQTIATNFKISTTTVRAVARTEEAVISSVKKDIRGELMLLSREALGKYKEALEGDLVDPKNIPVQVAIMLDKALLLEGSATSRVEVVNNDNSIESFLDQWTKTGVIEAQTTSIKRVNEESNS